VILARTGADLARLLRLGLLLMVAGAGVRRMGQRRET
jgi:hypothetical protein